MRNKENEYYVAISVDGIVKKAELCNSLIDAKNWAEEFDGENYTVSIYKNSDDIPCLKYEKKGFF